MLHNDVSLSLTHPLNCYDSRTYATRVPDLFKSRDGLSKAALRVYEALDLTQAQKAAELARKLKRNRSSVGRQLKQLANFGLAAKVDNKWLKLDADLEKLAEEQGTAEAVERTRAYNESLREGYRAYLKRKGNPSAEGPHENDVQPRKGEMVSEAGAALRNDGARALPERGAEPISSGDGRGVPAERVETLGHNPSSVLPNARARQSIGGMAMGKYAEEREAACEGCGNTLSFSAPDLRPYSCADCHGKFVFVDELAMVAA